jgi:hypothetical protein
VVKLAASVVGGDYSGGPSLEGEIDVLWVQHALQLLYADVWMKGRRLSQLPTRQANRSEAQVQACPLSDQHHTAGTCWQSLLAVRINLFTTLGLARQCGARLHHNGQLANGAQVRDDVPREAVIHILGKLICKPRCPSATKVAGRASAAAMRRVLRVAEGEAFRKAEGVSYVCLPIAEDWSVNGDDQSTVTETLR